MTNVEMPAKSGRPKTDQRHQRPIPLLQAEESLEEEHGDLGTSETELTEPEHGEVEGDHTPPEG